ncbi:hypothetical protein [Burkholderia gladioli]|uniref:hypothetical protein n=1 Tax=Burkholderia gladioli TaxID=28095 RepID=UPI001641FF41|nr:hypothetical protein [Burkholderia gladioli]MDA0573921.1 hypothetical protein [Burkholderia gladioli]MDA0603294.1 hypothetical protein [Burkholderia gladioli]
MDKKIAVARCHEIQIAIRDKEVPRFESIPEIGMAVHLAIHIRGLPLIDYEKLKLVASTMLGIPRLSVDRIINLLAEIEFVKLQQTGKRIQAVLPLVPYFDDLYEGLGEYLENAGSLDEFETLTLEIVDRLANSPQNTDALASKLGADRKAFNSSVEIGQQASFLIARRARSKTILMNPTYFSENAEVFADHVAKCGAESVKKTLELIRKAQGWPLPLIERNGEIAGTRIDGEDVMLLKRLAQDGIVKPPTISTTHAGDTAFIFTPTPGSSNVSPFRREQYEKSLAIVSAVRQGQLLPNRFRIRSPGAVLYKLKTDLELNPTSDYAEQYQNLVHLRIAQLVQLDSGYRQLKIIDTPENREALNVAYRLVSDGNPPDLSLDKEAMNAMTGSQEYVESLISSKNMRDREKVTLSDEKKFEIGQLLLEGF